MREQLFDYFLKPTGASVRDFHAFCVKITPNK